MRFISFVILISFFAVQSALAQVTSNGFGIHVAGETDIEAPSTPTLLSATPIAATQIDLNWTASTDNATVSGYSIFRDGTPIATTSLLIYSDTGLAASTTYSYVVRAFDPSLNYSSTSNSIATTTPDAPPPPVVTGEEGTSGTAARVVLESFFIETGVSTTSFSLQTAHRARLEIRWGRTASYELGYVMSDVFTKEHFVLLTDLEPNTTYEYEIVGYTPAGFETVLKRGSFETVGVVQSVLPPNVRYFQAIGRGDDVALRWELPYAETFSQVRIVRSHLHFPEHPQDGAVVYQGLESVAQDRGILGTHSPVYYTAFVYDTYGNVSSGAVAIVYATDPTQGVSVPEIGELVSTEEATSSIVVERVTIDMKMPKLADLLLIQAGVQSAFADEQITLDTIHSFTLSLPRTAVAGNLKSIIATVYDGSTGQTPSSLLLRLNKNGTAYEAEVAPVSTAGQGFIVVEIYDYEAFVVGTYQTPVTFVTVTVPEYAPVLFPDVLFKYTPLILSLVGVVLLLLFITIVVKRRQAEDNR